MYSTYITCLTYHQNLKSDNSNLNVFIGEDLQNVLLLLNTGTPPLDDIRIRKTVIHAIDKDHLVRKELGGFTDPM